MAKKKSLRERMEERREALNSKGGNYNFFIFPKEGIYRMRHLFTGEDEEPALEVIYIYLNKEMGGYISPKTWGGKDAVWDLAEELKASKSESDKKLGKQWAGKKQYVSPAFRYKDEKGKQIDTENGVKLVLLKAGQYQSLIDLFLDEENGDMTDPINGYDIKHKRTGMGQMDTKYTMTVCKPSKIPKEYRGVYNVEEMARALTPTYKQTKEYAEKLLNISAGGDDDDDDSSSKKKKKSKDKDKKKKKKNRDI